MAIKLYKSQINISQQPSTVETAKLNPNFGQEVFQGQQSLLKVATAIEDAHRKAEEGGKPVSGDNLVANILVINSSEDPEAAAEEFATTGDLWAKAGETDMSDREAFYDLYSKTQVAPKAPTSTFRIKDPQALGMALPGGEDYTSQSKMYEKHMKQSKSPYYMVDFTHCTL